MARRLIGVVVLLLAVAGCGGDPKADRPPAPSTSPVSTTPSASPNVPALPAEALANTKAGAIAFVRYYVESFNEAQRTGSAAVVDSLSADSCSECQGVVEGLAKIYSAGGHIEGGALQGRAATAEYNRAERVWLVLIRVNSGPQTVFASKDAQPKQLPGGSRAMRFSVVRDGESWKVTQWADK